MRRHDMFVAIDVETANPDIGSICQIGIAEFSDDKVSAEWDSLVDPEDYFDSLNVSIHGIDEDAVQGAPVFPELATRLAGSLSGKVVVCHTPFDRSAITKAAERYGLDPPNCTWLDSARLARRVWTQFAQRGFGLASMARFLGYEFQHHDALEDAKAAGQIVVAAMRESGMGIEALINKIYSPTSMRGDRIRKDGDANGSLFGECVVFTGALQMPRREAAELAAKLGCAVHPGVTKKTTLLVVGDQDLDKLAGHEKSRKHRRAEELIAQGSSIRILKESDFQRLVELGDTG